MINEKEALIQSIEDVNKQLKEKETETARKKKEYMMDLQRQVSFKYNFSVGMSVIFTIGHQ